MQLAEQLHAASIGCFPCKVTWNEAKKRHDKQPITVGGESWQLTAKRPVNDPMIPWDGVTVVGVPIPDGVVILDGDWYKDGAGKAEAEAILGSIPWAEALIQTTVSGGEHYAFRAPDWPVRQSSNFGGTGLDTRAAGKGFICTGEGYTPVGMGCFRLAYPQNLPPLPNSCREALEHKTSEAKSTPPPTEPLEGQTALIEEALGFLSPDVTHDEWIKTGMALRHHFQSDPDLGFALFDRWSYGDMSPDKECPASYVPEAVSKEFWSLKALRGDGKDITIATVIYRAVNEGWKLPKTFDTSLAFGEAAAPVERFSAVLASIHESGTDSNAVEGILEAIVTSGFDELQAGLLRGELKAALRSAKLLDKNLTATIDRQIGGQTSTPLGMYGKSHTDNALLFLERKYPNGTLIRKEKTWYAYNGKVWEDASDDNITHQVTMDMLSSRPQEGTTASTVRVLSSIVHRSDIEMNPIDNHFTIFQNGVLDLKTYLLGPFSPNYYTTAILPYDYQPYAVAPNWLAFLAGSVESDQDTVDHVQEWLGYMMSPTYQYQKIMLFVGVQRGGKSIIGKIMKELVGPLNYIGTSLDSFSDDDTLEAMQRRTVAFSGDTVKDPVRANANRIVERLKKISGGDEVDFKRKYISRGSGVLPTRLTFSANQHPRLFDDSGALGGRFLIIPFNTSYKNNENPDLFDNLKLEMEGIAVWALEGLRRLNARGKFLIPERSQVEIEAMKEGYSSLTMFLDDCCHLGGEHVTGLREIYDSYRAWSIAQQEEKIMGIRTLSGALKETVRGKGCTYGTYWEGSKKIRGFRGIQIVGPEGNHANAFKPEIVS